LIIVTSIASIVGFLLLFFFSSRRRHTRFSRDWSSDVCSSDLAAPHLPARGALGACAADLAHDRARRRVRAAPGRPAGVPAARLQIGRASCRERVESVGIAVYL